MQCAARSSGRVILNEPRNDFASPVRELATTTASRISSPEQKNQTLPAKSATRNHALRPLPPVPGSVRQRSCLLEPDASTKGRVPRVRRAVAEIPRCGGRPYPGPPCPHTTSDRPDRPGIRSHLDK